MGNYGVVSVLLLLTVASLFCYCWHSVLSLLDYYLLWSESPLPSIAASFIEADINFALPLSVYHTDFMLPITASSQYKHQCRDP